MITPLTIACLAIGQAVPAEGPPLRACCALGHDLSVDLGPLRAPISLDNVVDVEGLGPGRSGSPFDEQNGLLYTCQGGFIDTAHLRTTLDWTRFIARALEGGALRISLPPSSGAVALELSPTPEDGDPAALRRRVAASVAYELAVWHEVLSHYAPTQFDAFGEAFSTFSPEDLYSDALGAALGERLLESEGAAEAGPSIVATLQSLGPRPRSDTKAALDAVAGAWWDPSARLPDGALLRRHALPDPEMITPWQLPDPQVAGCPTSPALSLALPRTTPSGQPLGCRYTLELRVPPALGPRLGAPLTSRDLPRLVGMVGEELRAQKGAQATTWARPSAGADDGAPAAKTRTATVTLAPAPAAATRRRAASELEGIRLLTLELFGALDESDGEAREGAGLRITGGALESRGGDLAFMKMTVSELGAPSGLVVHLVGLESRALWFGSARGEGTLVAPIAALFRDVEDQGVFGLGGKLFALQLDTATGRRVVRPIELNLAVNLLGNGQSPEYLLRQLVLSTGLSVDDHRPAAGPSDTSLRGGLLLFGALRDPGSSLEVSGFLGLRQDLLDRSDRHLELGGRLGSRLRLRDDHGVHQATLGVFVEGAYQRWARPDAQLADWVLALGGRGADESAHLALVLSFSDERLGF